MTGRLLQALEGPSAHPTSHLLMAFPTRYDPHEHSSISGWLEGSLWELPLLCPVFSPCSALLSYSTTAIFSPLPYHLEHHCPRRLSSTKYVTMPYQWNAERERQMLLLAISRANLRPSADTWTAVAALLGGGLSPSAVR